MNGREHIAPLGGSISDRLTEESRGGPLGGAPAGGADSRQIDDLASDSGTQGHANYRSPGFDPRSEPGSLGPFYRPYEPEMPPPVGYERLAPPPPALVPEPEPTLPKYNDSLMTEALFNWGMRHDDAANIPREGPVGSFSDVIPARLAEIVIDSLFLDPPPPNEPW